MLSNSPEDFFNAEQGKPCKGGYPARLAVSESLPNTALIFFLTHTHNMANQSRVQELFESALQAYEKKTGITLAQHPLFMKLQS